MVRELDQNLRPATAAYLYANHLPRLPNESRWLTLTGDALICLGTSIVDAVVVSIPPTPSRDGYLPLRFPAPYHSAHPRRLHA
jgi:hypothetical protein